MKNRECARGYIPCLGVWADKHAFWRCYKKLLAAAFVCTESLFCIHNIDTVPFQKKAAFFVNAGIGNQAVDF